MVSPRPQLIDDQAVNNNDAAAVAALYTEDAVFLTDRGPVCGPQAVEKWYADVFKAWHPKTISAREIQIPLAL
jgi:ketosteroid isomerase-like protein